MWIQPGSGDGLDVLFRKSEVQREILAQTFTVLSDPQYRTGFWESGVPSSPRLTGHRRILAIQSAVCDTQTSQGSAGSHCSALTCRLGPALSRLGKLHPRPWGNAAAPQRLSLPPLLLEPLTLSTSGTACAPIRAKHCGVLTAGAPKMCDPAREREQEGPRPAGIG